MINTHFGAILDSVSGLLMVALGIFVLVVKPRATANRAVFAYATGFGVPITIYNLVVGQVFDGYQFVYALYAVGMYLAVAGIIALALVYPTRIARKDWRLLILPGTVAIAYLAFSITIISTSGAGVIGVLAGPEVLWTAYLWGWGYPYMTLMPALAFLILLAPIRFAQTPEETPGFAVVSGGLSTFYGAAGGALMFMLPPWKSIFVIQVGIAILAAAMWLYVARERAPRLGRNMALVLLAVPLIAMLTAVNLTPDEVERVGLFGVARLATVVVVGYAVVRHQLLGFNVKVRWTISRGTIAAAFVAVFFVASEMAAELLGGTAAGPIAGIVAAGVLVFFLAPLQRWADRFASAATGDAKPVADQTAAERETVYLRMATAAWADGNLNRHERAMLDALRETLQISRGAALSIESRASKL